ncbi:thiamine pyrophosphate-dependent enzyme, partial [Staphylococcus epidermidis]|uniref:thiamine pyrophosphate-dependent enzyme n=1 Tax=Staphylococcus epidermidis TaxID=1282 RepID=UPI0021B43AC8
LKKRGKNPLPITYTRDRRSSQPDFYQRINFPSPYKAPPIFLIQNNNYPISTPPTKQTPPQTLPQKPISLPIPPIQLHPIHPLPLYQPTLQPPQRPLPPQPPTLIQTLTYPYPPHTIPPHHP